MGSMTAAEIIQILQLQPHPKEKGYYLETYRSEEIISGTSLPHRYGAERSCSTAIYFLLEANGFSEMHRLKSDEIFHFYLGAPIELLLLKPDGEGKIIHLGNELEGGHLPQIVIPHDCWQGMRTTGEFSLIGCTVAPGFAFSDYESGRREDLVQKYPNFRDWIVKFTEF
jgi:predicted cupin superfamily sugar epimerase